MKNAQGFDVTESYLAEKFYRAFFEGYQSAPVEFESYPFTPGTMDDPNRRGIRKADDAMRERARHAAAAFAKAIAEATPPYEPDSDDDDDEPEHDDD